MATVTYLVGKVDIEGNEVGCVVNATITIAGEIGDKSALNDEWRAVAALGQSWRLEFTCYYDPDGTAIAALRTEFISGDRALSSVQMWEDASNHLSGNGVLTNFALTKAVGAIDSVAVTIEGDGALAYT